MTYKPPIAAPKKYKTSQGFSLLEAIVALTLISLTGVAIFSWINQSLKNLSVISRQDIQLQRVENALAYVRTINPMKTPQGSSQIGDLQLSWQSELIEPINRSVSRRGGFGNYQVGLYSLDVTLEQSDMSDYVFTVRQPGYLEIK